MEPLAFFTLSILDDTSRSMGLECLENVEFKCVKCYCLIQVIANDS